MHSTRAVRWVAGLVTLAAVSAAALAEGADDRSLTNSGTVYNSLWTIGIFVVMFVVLGRLVWKPAMQVLQDREVLIETHIAQAEAHKMEGERLLAQYQAQLAAAEAQVAARLQQAQAQAEQARLEILAAARRQADDVVRHASEEIDAARKAAIEEIAALGAELATAAASSIIRKELSPEDHRRIVAESLEEIRSRGARSWAN